VQTPPASRQRVWLTLWMAAPLGVLTVLLLADTLHRAVGRGDSTERPPRGWLAALGHKGTASQWSSALGDLFAWSLADFHATLHRSMHRRTVRGWRTSMSNSWRAAACIKCKQLQKCTFLTANWLARSLTTTSITCRR